MSTPPPAYPDISKMQPEQMEQQQMMQQQQQQMMPPQQQMMQPQQQMMQPQQQQMMQPQQQMMQPQQQMMQPQQQHMMPPQQQQMTMVQQPMPQQQMLKQQMHSVRFTEIPALVQCPYCQNRVQTMLRYQSGCFTWLMAGILAFFLWWCIFPCFIPFFSKSCKDVEHLCPSCYRSIGKYNRI